MTWIKDTYASIKGETELAHEGCCTGKIIQQGGITGRTESTGLGVYYCVRELCKTKSFVKKSELGLMGLKGKKIIMQGFGNVGYWAAKFFEEDGAKIVAIAEYNSAIYHSKGINV